MDKPENLTFPSLYNANINLDIITEKSLLEDSDVTMNKPFISTHVVIILNIAGTVKLQCNLESIQIENNSLYIVIPNLTYLIESFSDDCQFIGLRIHPDVLIQSGIHLTGSEMFSMISLSAKRNCMVTQQEAAVISSMLTLVSDKLASDNSLHFRREVIQYQVMALLFETSSIIKKYNHEHIIKLNRKEDLSARFFEILWLHFKSERSIQFYARALSVSPGHLTKTLKDVTGKTAGELIDSSVILEAKLLLDNPALSILQVAQELQFSNQSFFGKYFKKYTGLSPSEFRSNAVKTKNNLF